jgi:hypothetical protein
METNVPTKEQEGPGSTIPSWPPDRIHSYDTGRCRMGRAASGRHIQPQYLYIQARESGN